MNDMQKKTLIAIGAVVLGMLLYPPYRVVHRYSIVETGYTWIFSLPDQAILDVSALVVQWLGVLIVGGIAFFVQKDKK